ncbi:MAG: VTC domain-containing protein, partial [Candidatus Kryptonium sp.]
MVGRVELKYLVRMELYDELKKRIEPFVVRDRPSYTVRSIYFDTPNLDYYNDKVEGLEIRKKVRIRVYDVEKDDSFAFLEIKRKHGLMIFKNRAVVFYSNLEKFLETGDIEKYVLKTEPTSRENARKFLYNLFVHKLKPVILVTYDREAFHGKFNQEIRI